MAFVANRHASVDLLGIEGVFDIVISLIEFVISNSLQATINVIQEYYYEYQRYYDKAYENFIA